MKKVYLGLVTDHSGSMYSVRKSAISDINNIIQNYVKEVDDDISVLVTENQVSNVSKRTSTGVDVQKYNGLYDYHTGGMTALLDGIGDILTEFKTISKYDKDAQFIVMIFTDGEENCSNVYTIEAVKKLILETQTEKNTTITFRGPSAVKNLVSNLGMFLTNAYFWDGELTTEKYTASTINTSAAITRYMSDARVGVRSTDSFYTNLNQTSVSDILQHAQDISQYVKILTSTQDEIVQPWVQKETGSFIKGTVYYQLTKTEDVVQDYKIILIRDKISGKVYGGRDARSVLGLPISGNCRVKPGDHGKFDIYIQSTSINRKIPAGNSIVIWDGLKLIPTPKHAPISDKRIPLVAKLVAKMSIADMYHLGYYAGKARKAKDASLKGEYDYERGYKDARQKKVYNP